MAREQVCLCLAAAAAAAILGGTAFTAGPGVSLGGVPSLRGSGLAESMPADEQRPPLAPLFSASALALGVAAWSSRRHVKVAAAGVLTRDSAGRVRFAAPVEPLVPSEQPGATAPLGFFDPLGFSSSPLMTFENDDNGFRHLREAELKHGRVCMMGALGSIFAHYVKFPGFEKVPSGLAALSDPMGSAGFGVLLMIVGLIEALNWKPKDVPGNFGDPLKLGNYTEEMRNKELNNGRIAMFALTGQIAAELVSGKGPAAQMGM